ncbi:MAG: hypothetical protein MUC30_04675 [Bacteroidales bacterium]|nr:hypothetical protein [Bacteroidales bacterium]
MAKISIPFLAELWKKEDLKTVDDIYLRSSINQYAAGLLIFIGLMVNLGNIFRILPEEYGSSYAVIVLIGLGNLVNVSAGINGVVLSTSALYRYQTWLMFILIGLFVIASLIFIPLMGITGAAVASLISNAIYNLLCVGVVGWKYSLWPYRMNHLRMTLVAAVAFVAGTLVPEMPLLPDLMLRSALVTFIFTAGLYLLKLSDDMNKMVDVILDVIRKGFRQS